MNVEKIKQAIAGNLEVIYISTGCNVELKYAFGSMAVEVGINVYDTCRNILRTAIMKLAGDSGSFTEAKIYMGPPACPAAAWIYNVLVEGG